MRWLVPIALLLALTSCSSRTFVTTSTIKTTAAKCEVTHPLISRAWLNCINAQLEPIYANTETRVITSDSALSVMESAGLLVANVEKHQLSRKDARGRFTKLLETFHQEERRQEEIRRRHHEDFVRNRPVACRPFGHSFTCF